MLLSRRLPMGSIIDVCRSLRYSLGSGMMLREVMELLASKGTRPVRPVAAQIVKDLKSGWRLQEALENQRAAFPPLFVALATVGEESGNLPEVLSEVENYYLLQQKLHREFRQQIMWPVMQLFAAILVIAGLIYILGIIASSRGEGKPIDPLGLGLVGPQGAITFLLLTAGAGLVIAILYLVTRRLLRRRPMIERQLLRFPIVGPCLTAMALTRFCVALHLMLETNLAILKTFRLAFVATDNTAFIAACPKVEASLRQGNNIATSLQAAKIFPEKFVSAVAVAEESGRLPEVMAHLSTEYEDETRRRLALLNQIASWVVWLIVATIIITAIFRIFLIVYLQNIEKNLPGA